MKKKIVTVLMTAAIGTSMLAGQTVMAAETTTETAAETKTDEDKASDETEEKTIGKKPETDKDAEGVFSLKFKNLTGKVITGVTVKNEKDEKYPDNFLEKDDKFAADEERTLWFDPNAAKDEAANTDTAEDKGTEAAEEVQKYDMQITFEDETTATLHTLPFGDTEEAELHLEGDVAYIIFDSKDLKKQRRQNRHWHQSRQKHRYSRVLHRQRITAMTVQKITVMIMMKTMTMITAMTKVTMGIMMIPEILLPKVATMDAWIMQF